MYDAVVIGAGPGGYVCAIRAAQLGGNVCLVEKNGLGGTCTQRGCIPTKFLHSAGDILRKTRNAKLNGIDAQLRLDYKVMRDRMQSTVKKLASGIKLLLESNNVDLIEGEGRIISKNAVSVGGKTIDTKHTVIATGSYPVCLPGYEFNETILSTDTILELEKLPRSVIVVGGGYSGCEFASILNVLGVKMTLIEAEDHLMPLLVREIGDTVEKYMRLDGIDVRTRAKVQKIEGNAVIVDGEKVESDKILVCIGRKPNIREEELTKLDIRFNEQGVIVDEEMRTSVENIFAIGDVTGKYELAHVASKQAEVAAQNVMGIKSKIDYRVVPACIFTYPEVAFVGELEGRSGDFPLTASAKANCLGETRGFVKVFERDGIIVGTIFIGAHAGEMISEAALAIKMRLRIEDIFDTIHPHPTLPESFAEALRAINNKAIHMPAKKSNK